MMMKFTEDLLERIEKNYSKKQKENQYREGLGLNVSNSMGATVFKNNWGICKVEELTQMIDELTELRKAIIEETGIEF